MLDIMYCPHCSAQNAKETKFCRGCGEDLRLVSQAVTRSLPLVIAQRVDEAIDRGRGGWQSYQLFRTEHRKAFGQIMMALSSLFIIVWMLMLGHGSVSFAAGFLLVMSVSMLLTSAHELWSKKRLAREADGLSSSFSTKELPASDEVPVMSITESTTRDLNVLPRLNKREDELNQP
jgi:ribosomal protein L40E